MQKTIIDIENAIPLSSQFQFYTPVNWTLREGDHWAFLGPNGAGKSLLAKMIRGELSLVSGKIKYQFPNDKPVYQQIKLASFQDIYSLADFKSFYYQQRWNSTEEETPIIIDILRREYNDDEINKMAEFFSAQDLLNKNLILLSSGELRKFLIIRMLLSQPKILIIDNPFIGLDEKSRNLFNKLLGEISKTTNIQIILLISDPKDLPTWCKNVLPINSGRVLMNKTTRLRYLRNEQLDNFLFNKNFRDLSGLFDLARGMENKPFLGPVVDMQGINIKYGERTILKNLYWKIRKGEKWALLGPNGAGKSTLLSLIYADNPQAYANYFYLFGRKRGSGESIWEIKKRIGFVSPEFHLYFKSINSCQEIIASGFSDYSSLYRKSSEYELKNASLWMEAAGISQLKDRLFTQISYGEQRMVILLRALVKNPDLLILDEPLHGLDKGNKQIALALINKFSSQKGKTLIYVTHYKNEIPESVNRKLLLQKN